MKATMLLVIGLALVGGAIGLVAPAADAANQCDIVFQPDCPGIVCIDGSGDTWFLCVPP